ncbi:MAG: hypothetical protein HUU37_01915 [Bdellovibrionales bacterium]|nr:hypothetical protein [Bdellovibrionales bacterium]
MKTLISALILLHAPAAFSWIQLQPDHPNLHWNAGDQAEVMVTSLHEPSTTGWKIRVFASFNGEPGQEVPLTRGAGRWVSPALTEGQSMARFEARLQGPASNPVDRIVEVSEVQMEVGE